MNVIKALKNGVFFTTLGPNGLQSLADRYMEVAKEYANCQVFASTKVLLPVCLYSYSMVISKLWWTRQWM